MIKFINAKTDYERKIVEKLQKEYKELKLENHEIEVAFNANLEETKQYSEWYRGDLITVNIDNRYTSYFITSGMVQGVIGNAESEINFKRDHSSIRDLLELHNINNDEDFDKALENGEEENYKETFLQIEYSCWYEVVAYDKKEERWYESDTDGCVFEINDFSLKYALWYIPEFYKLFNPEEEQK